MSGHGLISSLKFIGNIEKDYEIICKEIRTYPSKTSINLGRKIYKILNLEKEYLEIYSKTTHYLKEYTKYSKLKHISTSNTDISFYGDHMNETLDSLHSTSNDLKKKLSELNSENNLYIVSKIIEI